MHDTRAELAVSARVLYDNAVSILEEIKSIDASKKTASTTL